MSIYGNLQGRSGLYPGQRVNTAKDDIEEDEESFLDKALQLASVGSSVISPWNKFQQRKLKNSNLLQNQDLTFSTDNVAIKNPLYDLNDNKEGVDKFIQNPDYKTKNYFKPKEGINLGKWDKRIELDPNNPESIETIYDNVVKQGDFSNKELSNLLGADHKEWKKYQMEQDYRYSIGERNEPATYKEFIVDNDAINASKNYEEALTKNKDTAVKELKDYNKDGNINTNDAVELDKLNTSAKAKDINLLDKEYASDVNIPFLESMGTDYGPFKRLGTDAGPLQSFSRKKGFGTLGSETGFFRRIGDGAVKDVFSKSKVGQVTKAFKNINKGGFKTLFGIGDTAAKAQSAIAGIQGASGVTSTAATAANAAAGTANAGLFASMGPVGWTMLALSVLGAGKVFKPHTLFGKIFSDSRLKENIKKISKSPSGINVYEFKYKNIDGTYRGVLADEVPWAASRDKSGYMMVDYSKVDVDFVKVI